MIDQKNRRHINAALLAIERLKIVLNENSLEKSKEDFRVSDVLLLEFENLANECIKLDEYIFKNYPNFPLDQMRAIRNRVAHDYLSVSIDILYETIENDLPEVEKILKAIIKSGD